MAQGEFNLKLVEISNSVSTGSCESRELMMKGSPLKSKAFKVLVS
jgi:hypothetical protein